MATTIEIYNQALNIYEESFTVDASFTATGCWHDGRTWYFYNGANMWHYYLIDGVFDRDIGVAIGSKIGTYTGEPGGMVGDETSLYFAHAGQIIRGGVQLVVEISVFNKKTFDFVETLYQENQSFANNESVHYDITHNGTHIVGVKRNAAADFQKQWINVSTGKKDLTTTGTVEWKGITYDDGAYWVNKDNGAVNYHYETATGIGPISSTNGTPHKGSCLIRDSEGKSTGKLAVIKN